MARTNVTALPRRGRTGYDDTAAVNDIHALLTTSDRDLAVLGDVAALVARTGRPLVRARSIVASTSESPFGWPVARVDAEETTVIIRQDPAGTGLLIEITTREAAEPDRVTVTHDGRCLNHCQPPGGHAA